MPLVAAMPKDDASPAVLDVTEILITRGADSSEAGSCGDAGLIEIVLGEVAAGYHVQLKGGNLPVGLFPDYYVVPSLEGKHRLLFPWSDWPRRPATRVTATIQIRAIDEYGQLGKSQVFELVESY